MTTMLEVLDTIGGAVWEPVWVPVLVWTLLAVPVWLALQRIDRLHPLARYRLLQVVLASLPLGLGAAVLASLLPDAAPAGIQRISVSVLPAVEATGPSSSAPSWRWTHVVGFLTVAAVGWSLVRLGRLGLAARAAVLARAHLDCEPASSVQARATHTARRVGASRSVRACLTPRATVPVTLGGLRPTILLPVDLADKPETLRMTLVHECLHVRRCDDLAHLLERIIGALFAAHPLVTRLLGDIATAREQACDAVVLNDDRINGADYARLLVGFADGRSPHRLDTLSLSESPSTLTNRLRTMRSSVADGLSSPRALAATLVSVGLFLVLGIVACSETVPSSPSSSTNKKLTDAPAETDSSDDVYVKVNDQPDCGGVRALSEHIQYPDVAKEAGIEGRVIVEFIVDETGTPTEPTVKKGVHDALDEAAIAAVRQLDCEPGTLQGEPVKVEMAIPITFKIPKNQTSSSATSSSNGDVRPLGKEGQRRASSTKVAPSERSFDLAI